MKALIKYILSRYDREIVEKRSLIDFSLEEYDSYEDYKRSQVFWNKTKIDKVWADESTLDLIIDEIKRTTNKEEIFGLCHGTRNGFEQKHFNKALSGRTIGTDISDTAEDFEDTIQWDFHDVNKDWINKFDFVYSNSLDQGWKPKIALKNWLDQLNPNGRLFIEHTEQHGPKYASKKDPFGVKPTVMPYVLSEWFGHSISIKIIKSDKVRQRKDGKMKSIPVWIFVVKNV